MRNRFLMPVLSIAIVAGCNGPLDVKPKNTVPTESAITDSTSARAAVAGMYHGLQSLSSYGSDIPEVGDLSSDNAEFSGTSTSYGEIDDESDLDVQHLGAQHLGPGVRQHQPNERDSRQGGRAARTSTR